MPRKCLLLLHANYIIQLEGSSWLSVPLIENAIILKNVKVSSFSFTIFNKCSFHFRTNIIKSILKYKYNS